MGFADDFYYGQCKVVATSTASADNGKAVTITSSGGRTWSGTMAGGKCEFMLPPRDKYTVELVNSGVTQFSTDIYCGYGECKYVEVGMDPATPLGIKAIVNAGLEADFFTAGDEIYVKEGADSVKYRVLHVGYKTGTYGHNVILGRDVCLGSTRQMQTSNTNAGGYGATLVASYLDGTFYEGLGEDWQDVISDYTFQASVGSQSSNLKTEQHKIWLPLEYNIFGATTYAAGTEVTTGHAEQFAYFATAANRVKTVNNAASRWWLASPYVSNSTYFCDVNTTGAADGYNASNSNGVLPCFMIAADA